MHADSFAAKGKDGGEEVGKVARDVYGEGGEGDAVVDSRRKMAGGEDGEV